MFGTYLIDSMIIIVTRPLKSLYITWKRQHEVRRKWNKPTQWGGKFSKSSFVFQQKNSYDALKPIQVSKEK